MKSVWNVVSDGSWRRIDGVTVLRIWDQWIGMDARGQELSMYNNWAGRCQPRRYKTPEAAIRAVRRLWPLSSEAWGSYGELPQRPGLRRKVSPCLSTQLRELDGRPEDTVRSTAPAPAIDLGRRNDLSFGQQQPIFRLQPRPLALKRSSSRAENPVALDQRRPTIF